MVRKAGFGLIAAMLCMVLLGCGEKPADHRDELAQKALAAMESIKADRQNLEKTLADLEKQVAAIHANIAYLEQVQNELYSPREEITFWNTMDWMSDRANILILLLFVVWLFYSLLQRGKCRKTS